VRFAEHQSGLFAGGPVVLSIAREVRGWEQGPRVAVALHAYRAVEISLEVLDPPRRAKREYVSRDEPF
jgi:hypothetical protein